MQRSTESRMDYEYDNKSGPVDHASPFLKYAAQAQLQRSNNLAQAQLQRSNNLAQKRSFNDYKNTNSNVFPSLRQPTAQQQTFLFSQPQGSPTKPLPSIPVSAAFSTPRKFESDYDSSGVENPSSPEAADSEATPENMGFRSGMAKATTGISRLLDNSRKEKQNSIFQSPAASSPRTTALKPYYSHGIEKRRKRGKREGEKRLIHRKGSSASEDEEDTKANSNDTAATAPKAGGPGPVAALFGFIHSHPDLPHILSFYAQLLLNVFLVFFFIYIIYSFWATIQSDVDKKSEEAMADVLADMAICAQNYRENRCEPSTRMPALEAVCTNWEKCMNRDPRSIGRAKVSAHTFAEIFNSFIEPISYKAMIFSFLIVFGCVAISNFAFGFFRTKAHPMPPPYPAYMQTPMRQASGQYDAHYSGYRSAMPQEPAASAGALPPQTPRRQLEFN